MFGLINQFNDFLFQIQTVDVQKTSSYKRKRLPRRRRGLRHVRRRVEGQHGPPRRPDVAGNQKDPFPQQRMWNPVRLVQGKHPDNRDRDRTHSLLGHPGC